MATLTRKLAALNVGLTCLLVVFAVGGAFRLKAREDHVRQRALASGNVALQYVERHGRWPPADVALQGVAQVVGPMLRKATASFAFGSPDGTVPAFFADMLASNFSGLALDVDVLSTAVGDAALENLHSVGCNDTRVCTVDGENMVCPNGGSVYCAGIGQIVHCNGPCVNRYLVPPASLTSSVARHAALVQGVRPRGHHGPAAFSDGLFRLNSLIKWAKKQASVAEWRAVGGMCERFAAALGALPWTGTYVTPQGIITTYDAQWEVRTKTEQVQQICHALAHM